MNEIHLDSIRDLFELKIYLKEHEISVALYSEIKNCLFHKS